MDEPLSNLDAKLRIEMRAELKRLHLETNATFVYVTHDQLEAMTLSSRICLMKTGRVQQYAAPLDIYNQPANLFSAEFVGNPTMNFIDVECTGNTPGDIRLVSRSLSLKLAPLTGKPALTIGQKLVLGIRPEHIGLSENGSIRGRVYSTLPSGMETIVMIKIRDTLLTSVAFGGQDFDVDSDIGLTFDHDNYLVFDKDSGEKIAAGTLTIAGKNAYINT